MTVKVKICGLNTSAALKAAIEYGADWVGFVFFSRSPRYVSPQQAAALWQEAALRCEDSSQHGMRALPKIVGLFVGASWQEIDSARSFLPIDIVQYYGKVDYVRAIQKQLSLPVWHSCGISTVDDLPLETPANGLVVEAKTQKEDPLPGGMGHSFDWSLTAQWQAPVPWLLAGGLTAKNVQTALKQSMARAVDVSSGVETAPGKKEPALIRDFIMAAKKGLPPPA
ncbi:N-(5'-phosphoribosyl)anthranilate isomerase [Entomobacter blattae]|uniref:N-(5'-phosphoribosyl)anthranilate isomerase n=1 Tax=Entomobacter blattae TaxID=2762277 RepID=A0A7H1NPC8_9PROT|nr:phosphoribosylanthranilate isomerase [Entomobacter blattae]QNT77638.1 N-(5'-phosphoribosyl)anthranilate isomerase [Entomobacter blattae]